MSNLNARAFASSSRILTGLMMAAATLAVAPGAEAGLLLKPFAHAESEGKRPFLYYPQVHLEIREVEPATAQQFRFVAPWASLTLKGLLNTAPPAVIVPQGVGPVGVDPLAATDWALASMRLPATQNIVARPGQPAITVSVIDTGVDYNHEDLQRTMWRRPGAPRIVGRDTAHDRDTPYDLVKFDIEGCMADASCRYGIDQQKFLVNAGHGTHCAGRVGAIYNNAAGSRGTGAGARIMALKAFFDPDHPNAGGADDRALAKAIDFSVQNGARIISASWGGSMDRAQALQSPIYASLLRARQAGVLVVIAAGNSAQDQEAEEAPMYPAAYELDNTIVVAATDRNDALAKFSNYGGKSVHIGAPGVKILSTISGGGYSDQVARYTDANGKARAIDWNGTSMATPSVAGAAAAVWAKYPTADYREVRRRILDSARPVAALAGKVATAGVLDITAALR